MGYYDDMNWEEEKACDLRKNIKQYCIDNNIICPKLNTYTKSWTLKEIFKNLKL